MSSINDDDKKAATLYRNLANCGSAYVSDACGACRASRKLKHRNLLNCGTDFRSSRLKQFKIIIEKHHDGYVAYPLGLKGAVIGDGDTYEEALADVKSAIQCHVETFGHKMLEVDPPVLEVFVAEVGVTV